METSWTPQPSTNHHNCWNRKTLTINLFVNIRWLYHPQCVTYKRKRPWSRWISVSVPDWPVIQHNQTSCSRGEYFSCYPVACQSLGYLGEDHIYPSCALTEKLNQLLCKTLIAISQCCDLRRWENWMSLSLGLMSCLLLCSTCTVEKVCSHCGGGAILQNWYLDTPLSKSFSTFTAGTNLSNMHFGISLYMTAKAARSIIQTIGWVLISYAGLLFTHQKHITTTDSVVRDLIFHSYRHTTVMDHSGENWALALNWIYNAVLSVQSVSTLLASLSYSFLPIDNAECQALRCSFCLYTFFIN